MGARDWFLAGGALGDFFALGPSLQHFEQVVVCQGTAAIHRVALAIDAGERGPAGGPVTPLHFRVFFRVGPGANEALGDQGLDLGLAVILCQKARLWAHQSMSAKSNTGTPRSVAICQTSRVGAGHSILA